jgi:hypothetical protein
LRQCGWNFLRWVVEGAGNGSAIGIVKGGWFGFFGCDWEMDFWWYSNKRNASASAWAYSDYGWITLAYYITVISVDIYFRTDMISTHLWIFTWLINQLQSRM